MDKVVYISLTFFCFLLKSVDCSSKASDDCALTIWPRSISYFESRLVGFNPNFVHLRLELNSSVLYSVRSDVFKPLSWVWTYVSPHSRYPYLFWNIDYGLLSFGLLDSKTVDIDFVRIIVNGHCNLTFGTNETSILVAKALTGLIQNRSTESYHLYESSYFCYLAVDESVRGSISYLAALYLNYPIQYLNYVCCHGKYNYSIGNFQQYCNEKPHSKWKQSTIGPFMLGLCLFMYWPLIMFKVCAWFIKDDSINCTESGYVFPVIRGDYQSLNDGEDADAAHDDDDDWIYLNGDSPISLQHLPQVLLCNLNKTRPLLMSRLRRTVSILLTPCLIYLQLAMYKDGIGISQTNKVTVAELVKKGVPMGFLSLLGEREDRIKVFAPMLGGPVCLLIMFYVLSIIFLIVPRSLNEIVERGMPFKNMQSPLCLNVEDIIRLSKYHISPARGYEKGYAVVKCSIFMLITSGFWKEAYKIQTERVRNVFEKRNVANVLAFVFFPFYLIFCLVEIIICVLFYGIPILGFVTIMVKGAVKSLADIRQMSAIFNNAFVVLMGSCIALLSFSFYTYCIGLLFVQSFSFVCQIIIFCFIAVIIYPAVAFGYLFFCIVMFYYFVRLMKDFGDDYVELLSIAVEKSQELFIHANNVSFFDGQLVLSNVRTNGIRGITINDVQIDVAYNLLQRLNCQTDRPKIKMVNSVYGIPKPLFNYLVQQHKPVHIYVFKLILHLAVVILLVVTALEITSKYTYGATSEISEVMHVVFIVTVGALPRVLEVALTNSKESIERDIEVRRIEKSIIEYWNKVYDS